MSEALTPELIDKLRSLPIMDVSRREANEPNIKLLRQCGVAVERRRLDRTGRHNSIERTKAGDTLLATIDALILSRPPMTEQRPVTGGFRGRMFPERIKSSPDGGTEQ